MSMNERETFATHIELRKLRKTLKLPAHNWDKTPKKDVHISGA